MRKKKKGSTLVFVIAIFFMLITFGTAILTATTIGYRNQITENKRTQNLYESEAGIDVTYNIIGKAIEAAIFASNMAVETTLQGKTGITGNVPSNSVMAGYPMRPHKEWLKLAAYENRLPEMVKTVKQLQKEIDALKAQLKES